MSLIFFSYACFITFLMAAGIRLYQQKKLPLHLRWELYPVKHEAGQKAQYGGSFMEEPNWWKKERRRSLWNEIKYMIPEILLLHGLRVQNPSLWQVSFPFHLGLYLVSLTFGLLLIGALAMVLGGTISPSASFWFALIYYLTIIIGFLGLTMGTGGAGMLLARRFRDPHLKAYSALGDYLNLFILLSFLGVGLLAWLFHDQAFNGARAYVYALLTWGDRPALYQEKSTVLGSLTIGLGSFVLAYIPFTHMAHMFMKYFTYHKVRWEDTPNLRGSKIEGAVQANLVYKPTWSAPHIGADGKKTWVDIALKLPEDKK